MSDFSIKLDDLLKALDKLPGEQKRLIREHLERAIEKSGSDEMLTQERIPELNAGMIWINDPNDQSKLAHQDAKPATQIGEGRLVINQGDIYWVQLENPRELEPGIRHPYVVVQDNVFNHSRIHTVVVCALTSNIKRANLPGNVLLEVGEANLPKQSVVETSKVSSVDKAQLGEYIGSMTEERVRQILAGMRFLQLSFFAR